MPKNSEDIAGHTPQRPHQLMLSVTPRRSASGARTSISASRAIRIASSQRGSRSKCQQITTPLITSSRSTTGSSIAPSRLY